ncbi:MAG TPA: hypothetical protein VM888_04635, partial [Chitinophagaceae bacterium]|nr:hypothetical protein [Chitinophagaceae bacterium]
NTLQGQQWKYAVVGVGINVNQTYFGDLENKAVSLKQITGKEYDALEMAKELSAYLLSSYDNFKRAPSSVIEQYHQHLYKLNEEATFKKDSRVFNATVKGVTSEGQLKVEHGLEELFEVGSVEWLL